MKLFSFLSVASCVALLAASGCTKTEPKQPAPEEPKAAAEPAPAQRADAACMAVPATGTPEKFNIAGKEWELNGTTLRLTATVDGGGFKVGAISDIKEDSDENKKNLAQFLKWFKAEKVDAVVVSGDIGMDRPQIESSLNILAGLGVPVFAVIGNREGRADYNQAIEAVRKTHKHVFDLGRVRRIDTPFVDFVSLPGYYNRSFIHAADGCQYFEADVQALGELVKSSDSPVALVSHGGPKQTGAEGIDLTSDSDHVGDPWITAVIAEHKIPFGLFGNIHEAGGRATDLAGTTRLPQRTPHDNLYLNAGPADGVRWAMNDKSESLGMAAIASFVDGKASYRIRRQTEDGKGKVDEPAASAKATP